jgi:hypothetical protein
VVLQHDVVKLDVSMGYPNLVKGPQTLYKLLKDKFLRNFIAIYRLSGELVQADPFDEFLDYEDLVEVFEHIQEVGDVVRADHAQDADLVHVELEVRALHPAALKHLDGN